MEETSTVPEQPPRGVNRRAMLAGFGALLGGGAAAAWWSGDSADAASPSPQVTLEQFGGSPSATAAANDTAIDKAIAALGALGGRIVAASSGTYKFAAAHDFGNCDLVGQGGGAPGSTSAATVFQATAAAAQFAFTGFGGMTGNFALAGAGLATTPLARIQSTGAGSKRLFMNLSVDGNANDGTGKNALVQLHGSQNDVWICCTFVNAANDILWLDKGYGGAVFFGCQFAGAGRYAIRLDTAVANGPYPVPSDIEFDQCIVEGNSGSSIVWMNAGFDITFRGTDLGTGGGPSGPLVVVTGATAAPNNMLTLENLSILLSGGTTPAGSVALKVSGNGDLRIVGRLNVYNTENGIVLNGTSATVDINAVVNQYISGSGAQYACTGSADPAQFRRVSPVGSNAPHSTYDATAAGPAQIDASKSAYWWVLGYGQTINGLTIAKPANGQSLRILFINYFAATTLVLPGASAGFSWSGGDAKKPNLPTAQGSWLLVELLFNDSPGSPGWYEVSRTGTNP